jgi:hypothetical protein
VERERERERERVATAEPSPRLEPAPPERSPELALLALQRSHGNHAVGRFVQTLRSAPAPVLQRRIVIMPDAYASGLGVIGGPANFTAAQFKAYVAMAVKDDLDYAKAYANDQESATLDTHIDAIKQTGITMAQRIAALNQLITAVNAVQTRAGLKPNRDTRYATDSTDPGYAHTGEQTHWGDDPTMWDKFGKGLAAVQGGLNTVAPRGGTPRLPLKVLPWADAQRLLPRPLLNLIFDVRFQLDAAPGPNQPVIDERTATQRQHRDPTPNEPGTLRSWHQDSKLVLPANNMGANAPGHAQALHAHYTATSQSGTGSSIVAGGTGPTGYAEYTGTGSNTEHNTKVVLDYNQKRVYLTLTHYQYWAMLELESGTFEMWPSGTQDQEGAEGRLTDRMRDEKKPKVKSATMMSPWMEVLTT